jgi:endonuclease/exonuclease/phosphatase (EEP) superfamily protein YafD
MFFFPLWVFSYLGIFSFYFDLISNFKVQIFFVSTIITVLNVILKNWKMSSALFIVWMLTSFEIFSWYIPREHAFDTDKKLRVYYANVLTSNTKYNKLVEQVTKENPDMIAVVEIDKNWDEQISSIEGYPFKRVIPRADNFGIGVYSKYKLVDIEIQFFSKQRIPSIVCYVNVNGEKVFFILTHPMPPKSKEMFISRNGALKTMAKYMNEKENEKVIVVGDLNTAMWSPFYKQLVQKARLVNSREGFGIQSTWPTFYFTKIPLDHCLVGRKIKTGLFKLMDSIESDHLPFVVDLEF